MALTRSIALRVVFGVAAHAGLIRELKVGEPQKMPAIPEAIEAAVFMNLLPSSTAPVIGVVKTELKQNKSLLTQGSSHGTKSDIEETKVLPQVGPLGSGSMNATVFDGVGTGPTPTGVEQREVTTNYMWTWLQYLTFGAIVKVSCIIGNVLSQLSPYPSVKKFCTKGDTGDFDALPLVSIGFNGLQWCFYGLFAWWITGNHAFMILLYANICGAISGSFYTYSFHRLCKSEKGFRWLCRYYHVITGILLVQILAALMLPMRSAMFFEGFMASFCSVAVTISPIACLPVVLRTKSTEVMPVELAVVSLISSVLWLTCGVMLLDWWIIVPNIVGILAGLLAMTLLCIYPRKAGGFSPPSERTPLYTQASLSVGKAFDDDGCTGGTPSCVLANGSPDVEENRGANPQGLLL